MNRGWRRELMRPVHREFLSEMEFGDYSTAMPMDIDDDYDYMEMLDDGRLSAPLSRKVEDSYFFNSFGDDFDDSDIN